MSADAATAGLGADRGPAVLRLAPPRHRDAAEQPPISPTVELWLFALLGFVALAQWTRLVADSPMIHLLFALGAICVAGRLLRAIATGPRRGVASSLLAAVIAIGSFCIALVIAGLPARLLLPMHWGELAAGIGDGLRGIEEARLPYAGANEWIALDLTLAGPAMVAIAGAIAFLPARRRERRRVVALAVLIAAYATATALDDPAAELLWGFVLLVLSIAWLWIARLHGPRRNSALAVAVATAVVAMPVAARLGDEPVFDYKNWDVFGGADAVSFQWDHDYGPLDWQRDGATMLTVHSDRPLYWKASVLDRFDGFAWQRARTNVPLATAERAARRETPGGTLHRIHPEWLDEARFEIDGLETSLVIGAGTPLAIEGVDAAISSDGTVTNSGGVLEGGSGYSLVAYVPEPTAEEMRAAPANYPRERFAGSTLIGLPDQGGLPGYGLSVPLWGEGDGSVAARVLSSPYGDAYRLARTWTADAATPYDATVAIENRLREGYAYTPNVPEHQYPLAAFLFSDKAGYCQQFAGSMALMLRMVGIPSRVVSGFAPGTPDSSEGSYVVHDFDAHSWVEVYFRGIGWVTFDPTPAAAPAESQRLATDTIEIRGGAATPDPELDSQQGIPRLDSVAIAGTEQGGSSKLLLVVALAGLAAIALIMVAGLIEFSRRRRALLDGEAVESQVSELRMALERVGWQVLGGATLLELERGFTSAKRRPVAEYAAALRAHRYSKGEAPPPGPAQRRAMRQALVVGGAMRRLRGLLLIPPGGPRRSG